MTSRILGLLRESLMAAYFEKPITDAWAAAFRIPNLFRRLLGEGSLSVSFIPVFVEAKEDNQKRAQNLVNTLYSFLLILLGCLTAAGVLYPEPLLNMVLDPSYQSDTQRFLLTLRLTKIMFGFVFFISSYAFMMGLLNALGQFALPAIAPTFWNISTVIFMLLPKSSFEVEGDQLAIGVLIGGAAQALILVPSLIRSGYLPKWSLNYKNSDFLRVIRAMIPGLLGMGLMQFTTLVNLRFASSHDVGTISYINYVDRLIELPLSLISVSLGTALLPALSSFVAKKDFKNLSSTTKHYLELNLMTTMAAAAGLYSLAHPAVELLFGRGAFKPEDVYNTAEILKTYCWIMIFSSGVRVLTPAYYAVKNTKFPAIVSCLCLIVHIILAPLLMDLYQVHGLMISTIISAALNLLLLLLFFRKLVCDFSYKIFVKNLVVYMVLALIVGISAKIFYILRIYFPEGFLFLASNVFLSVLIGASTFVIAGYLLKINLVQDLTNKVLLRIKAKFKKT